MDISRRCDVASSCSGCRPAVLPELPPYRLQQPNPYHQFSPMPSLCVWARLEESLEKGWKWDGAVEPCKMQGTPWAVMVDEAFLWSAAIPYVPTASHTPR